MEPSALPEPAVLQRLCQSLAMLDAILQPDWEFRYYSFDSRWSADSMMASMRDGGGDDYFILFSPAGVIIKGYAHETSMARYVVEHGHPWPGVLDDVPLDFTAFLNEPAFSVQEATFCYWRRKSDTEWQRGNISFPEGDDPDGSDELMFILDGNPHTYHAWAEEYYERDIPFESVEHIYRHRSLTDSHISSLNPDVTLQTLEEDITEIGYP